MNNPNHASESLQTDFWCGSMMQKNPDPGWEKFGSGTRDKHSESTKPRTVHLRKEINTAPSSRSFFSKKIVILKTKFAKMIIGFSK
jgi:hypothetical protein